MTLQHDNTQVATGLAVDTDSTFVAAAFNGTTYLVSDIS
jgi:hypothetical protein